MAFWFRKILLAAGLLVSLAGCISDPDHQSLVTNSLTPLSPTPSFPIPSPQSLVNKSLTPLSPTPLSPAPLSPIPSPWSLVTPSPTPCSSRSGQITTHELASTLLPKPMPFRVYLPPCYNQATEKHYPVLYLIHGQSYNDDQWDRLGADEAAGRLISAGETPPFLIVMPRDRELSTQPDTNMFGEAVVTGLVPWIDEHYRTLPERQYRAIGGLSRGGGWALHMALKDWQLFGALGTHSLAIFWDDTYYIKTWLSEIPKDQMPRIYMDIGDHDRSSLMESNIWFEDLLTQRGIPHEWHLFTGYHEEAYWQEHVEDYLRWYALPWAEP